MIREIKEKDIKACSNLMGKVFAGPPWNEIWHEDDMLSRLINIYRTPDFYGFLYEQGGEIRAGLFGNWEQMSDGKHFFVKELFVDSGLQGQGIGSRLMKRLEEKLINEGIPHVYLLTTHVGEVDKFYRKQGYHVNDEIIVMNKTLNLDGQREMPGNETDAYQCVGIDACKGKWVAVAISDQGFEVSKYNTIDEICSKYSDCDTMLIDIPIGLRDSMDQVRPDAALKKAMGKKGSTVFDVPCRAAVYEEDKATARQKNIAALGKSLSEQSIGFSKSIRQVDTFLRQEPSWQNRLMESHPEHGFMTLNGGLVVMEKKTTPEGAERRLEILSRYFPEAGEVVEAFLNEVPARKKVDDVIDALCLAVIGRQTMLNGLRTIPETPMKDAYGLLMQIVTF